MDSLQDRQLLGYFAIPSPSHTPSHTFLYITRVFKTRVFSHKVICGYRNLQIHTSLAILLSNLCFVSQKISSDIFSYTITAMCTNQGNTHSISRAMGTIHSLITQPKGICTPAPSLNDAYDKITRQPIHRPNMS